jgi:ketosteroid isomerase-like protein
MSRENLDTARAGLDAVNSRDLDGLLRCCDTEVEARSDLVVGHAKAHGRGVSGVDVKWQAIIATRFRNGKIWRMASRPTEIDAVEAVGLSE